MPRPIHWPTAALPVADAPAPQPPTLLEALDCSGFLAALGPELSRLFGLRISARLASMAQLPGQPANTSPVPMLAAGRIRLVTATGPALLDIAIEAAAAASLVERLFGSSPAAPGSGSADPLAALPPGSGSWMSLARFLTTAVSRAMAAAGHPSAGPPALPPRAATPDTPQGTTSLPLGLDIDGMAGTLILTDPSAPAPLAVAEPPPHDARLWRRRTHARTMQLDLPVALRLADTRLLLSDIAALRPGDVIPLARPRALSVLVGGQRLTDIPAHRLLPEDPEDPTP